MVLVEQLLHQVQLVCLLLLMHQMVVLVAVVRVGDKPIQQVVLEGKVVMPELRSIRPIRVLLQQVPAF